MSFPEENFSHAYGCSYNTGYGFGDWGSYGCTVGIMGGGGHGSGRGDLGYGYCDGPRYYGFDLSPFKRSAYTVIRDFPPEFHEILEDLWVEAALCGSM